MQDHAVGTFDLAVNLRMSDCRPIHMDVMPIAEVLEHFAHELRAIVGDDDVGYPTLVAYVGEEEDGLLGANVCDGSSLDPFRELIDGHHQMGIFVCRHLEGAHEVEAPYRERASDGNHLQSVS